MSVNFINEHVLVHDENGRLKIFEDCTVRIDTSKNYFVKSEQGIVKINKKDVRISAHDFFPLCFSKLTDDEKKEFKYPSKTPFMCWLVKMKICEDVIKDTFYLECGKQAEKIIKTGPFFANSEEGKWLRESVFIGQTDAYKDGKIYEIKSVCNNKLSGYFDKDKNWNLKLDNKNMPFVSDHSVSKLRDWSFANVWSNGKNKGKNKCLFLKSDKDIFHEYIYQVSLYMWMEKQNNCKILVSIYDVKDWDGQRLNFIPELNKNTFIYDIEQYATIADDIKFCEEWYQKHICTGISPQLTKEDLIWLEKHIWQK